MRLANILLHNDFRTLRTESSLNIDLSKLDKLDICSNIFLFLLVCSRDERRFSIDDKL